MKLLLVNKFFFKKGGAENVFFDESELLIKAGHSIRFFSMLHPSNFDHPDSRYFIPRIEMEASSAIDALNVAMNTLYSSQAKIKLDLLIRDSHFDIAHLHNIYHQLSPSVLHTLHSHKIPTVMTLHDYKLVCGSYSMIANGSICEACSDGKYYNCFAKACVKGSRAKSALSTVEMYLHHSILHIYDLVDAYISPSRFLINKVREMGFKGRIEYLPNFVDTNQFSPAYKCGDRSIAYLGRLSKEKGIKTLLKAVKGLDIRLDILGDGPDREDLDAFTKSESLNNVIFLGHLSGEEMKAKVQGSMFLVLPSEWYENNPRSIIEGFALGKPAIGARIGGIPELIKDGETGYTFEMGNSEDLREKIIQLSNDPDSIVRMGQNARRFVETELNEEKHYQGLMEIYRSIMKN